MQVAQGSQTTSNTVVSITSDRTVLTGESSGRKYHFLKTPKLGEKILIGVMMLLFLGTMGYSMFNGITIWKDCVEDPDNCRPMSIPSGATMTIAPLVLIGMIVGFGVYEHMKGRKRQEYQKI